MQNKVIVAIKCCTFNHEPYIRDCLDGFVMQKTNFKFIAIVHDDASTDKTADIIREYEAKYPDIIKPIYETENQYSKHDGSLNRIMDAAIDATGAKYVALCEGDDYWTDPLKLQKQVDFMEKNLCFSVCFHSAVIKNECKIEPIIRCENIQDKEYIVNDIFPKWIIPTASILYRYECYSPKKWKHRKLMFAGDRPLVLECMKSGRLWGMSEKMSVYRMQQGSIMNSYKGDLELRYINQLKFLYYNFPAVDRKIIVDTICYYDIKQLEKSRNLFRKVEFHIDIFKFSKRKYLTLLKRRFKSLISSY